MTNIQSNENTSTTKKKTSKSNTKITNEDKEIDKIQKIINNELDDFKVNKTQKSNIIFNNKTK